MEPINWSTEWLTSLLWVARVFAFTASGSCWWPGCWSAVPAGVGSSGDCPAPISSPGGTTDGSWRPIVTFALLLLMAVANVRLDVIFSYQSNGLYTALQELDAPAFWKFIGIFAVLATINLVLVLVNFYVSQLQIIRWREWLNQRMVDDWLDGAAYHRGRFVREPIDNPDQRIQEDITSYTGVSQSLALGAASSVVSLVSFTIILWGLSGPLTLGGIEIPRAMVFIAYIYVIIATVIAFRIGRPLIRLNFLQERLGAYYRYALVRVRENSENVAFYRGEPVENAGLRGPVRRRHRQHLGHRVPEPEVPGLQLRGQPDRGGVPGDHPGAAATSASRSPSAT